MPERIEIELHCTHLPQGNSLLALQEGEGRVQVTSTVDRDSVLFRLSIEARPRRGVDEWDFGGKFVHGVAGERFLYLCWCREEEGRSVWYSRTKVPLHLLSQDALNQAIESQAPLRALLILVNEKGRLQSGTIKPPYVQWEVAPRG